MPKSKRDKKVSLTKTTKKGLTLKQELVGLVRKCVEQFDHIFLFTVDNVKNNHLKDLRDEWRDSRFFFGKNKVITLGLGRKKEDEIKENLHHLSTHVKGQCGLLFTNRPIDDVASYFENYKRDTFASTGFIPTATVTMEAGPLLTFPASLEPQLRPVGLPVRLDRGVVILESNYELCTKGKPLTPIQSKLLKFLAIQLADFKLNLLCCWSKDGTFKMLKQPSKETKTAESTESTSKEQPDDEDGGDSEMKMEEENPDSAVAE